MSYATIDCNIYTIFYLTVAFLRFDPAMHLALIDQPLLSSAAIAPFFLHLPQFPSNRLSGVSLEVQQTVI